MSVGLVVPLPAYTLDPAFIAKKAETWDSSPSGTTSIPFCR